MTSFVLVIFFGVSSFGFTLAEFTGANALNDCVKNAQRITARETGEPKGRVFYRFERAHCERIDR